MLALVLAGSIEPRPDRFACCGGALHGDLPAELASVSERIVLPAVAPVVTQHRRPAVQARGQNHHTAAVNPRESRSMGINVK